MARPIDAARRLMEVSPVLWAALAGLVGTIAAALVSYLTARSSARHSGRESQLQRYDTGLWETIRGLRADVDALRDEVEERDRRVEQMAAVIDQLRNQLVETRSDLAQVRVSERGLRRENEQLRQRVSELESLLPDPRRPRRPSAEEAL